LALGAAARLVDRFSQGVFFVDLAVLSDPGLLGQAVANALELQVMDTGIDSLAEYLARRQLLLVLDNCEHLLDGCTELVDSLQARCPELAILATSREALGVDGEQVFRVPSLKVETDAVRLFFDRAEAAGAQLSPESASEDTVAQICRRLDGIPLAIELAAARTSHLAAPQILERLSDRFRLLTGGRRRVQRQQTLSAAIDWSHDLLTDGDKTLFRRLSVFRGSFSLRAVEEFCDPEAVELLGSLVNRSLVNVQQEGAVVRYRLLETVRVYAEERLLASGEAVELRCAHRDWLLDWLESLPVGKLLEVAGGDQLSGVRRPRHRRCARRNRQGFAARDTFSSQDTNAALRRTVSHGYGRDQRRPDRSRLRASPGLGRDRAGVRDPARRSLLSPRLRRARCHYG
jgi:predicted ATPase